MNSKLKTYCVEQLAFTGFVLLDAKTAFWLRPDIWSNPTNSMCDLSDPDVEKGVALLGASLFEAKMDGQASVLRGATRSLLGLGARIELITGIRVADVRAVDTFSHEADTTEARMRQRPENTGVQEKPDNTAELREIAAMEPPAHDCALRQKILRARSELAERGLIY